MAQLFRMVRHPESTNSQTFTFILPDVITSESPPEIQSRDFLCGGLKWKVSFVRLDRHLSPRITLTSLSTGVACRLDFIITLLNRDSFSKNEVFTCNDAVFSGKVPFHEHHNFITCEEMISRRFTDSRGEFLVEANFRNVRCWYQEELLITSPQHKDAGEPSNHKFLGKHGRSLEEHEYQRYDSSKFTYSDVEWTVTFCPNSKVSDTGMPHHLLQISRTSRCDLLSRISYRAFLSPPLCSTDTDRIRSLKSGFHSDLVDFAGHTEGWCFSDDYRPLIKGSRMLLRIELVRFCFISRVKINPLSGSKNSVGFKDRERQSWTLCMSGNHEFLEFRLSYADLLKIPPNYVRYISWNVRLIPAQPELSESCNAVVSINDAPFEKYFSRSETEVDGTCMQTDLAIAKLKEQESHWLDPDDKKLTVHIEWLDSYLLCHSGYHFYDDIIKRHLYQMRREVKALQAENYQLEKELHKYHISIATKCSASHGGTPVKTYQSLHNTSGRTGSLESKTTSSSNSCVPARSSGSQDSNEYQPLKASSDRTLYGKGNQDSYPTVRTSSIDAIAEGSEFKTVGTSNNCMTGLATGSNVHNEYPVIKASSDRTLYRKASQDHSLAAGALSNNAITEAPIPECGKKKPPPLRHRGLSYLESVLHEDSGDEHVDELQERKSRSRSSSKIAEALSPAFDHINDCQTSKYPDQRTTNGSADLGNMHTSSSRFLGKSGAVSKHLTTSVSSHGNGAIRRSSVSTSLPDNKSISAGSTIRKSPCHVSGRYTKSPVDRDGPTRPLSALESPLFRQTTEFFPDDTHPYKDTDDSASARL